MAEVNAAQSLLPAVVFLTAAVVAVPLSKQLKLGAVLGYLIAGVLIGPQLLGLIQDEGTILAFSELGVVFLLFVLGLELSPQRLWVMRKHLFGMGSAQMGLATIVIATAAYFLGFGLGAAVVAGFGLALSSTAFVLQILAERDEVNSDHGRASFSVLLFQDLVAVPVLALIPLFGAQAVNANARPFWQSALLVVAAIVFVIFAGQYLLRPVFRWVASVKVTELFTAVSLLVVLGTAVLMHEVGLSMGLGAFLAGMLLAESEYSHEVEGHIEPFKGLLLGLFFMAVGMNLDLQLLLAKPLLILGIVLGLALLQLGLMWSVGRAFGQSHPSSLLMAALLASGGEFAFVVFKTAKDAALLAADQAAILNVVVALAMALTPLLVIAIQRFNQGLADKKPSREFDEFPNEATKVIIAGFGRVGQIPARILAAQRIPYTVIDPDTETVDSGRKFGGMIYYGDTTRVETLRAAKIEQAQVLILALDDMEQSIRTLRVAKRLNPGIKVIARARNRRHAHKLMDLGVDDPVRETLHSALLMTHMSLVALGLDEATASDRVERFKQVDQKALHDQFLFYDDEAALIQSAEQYRNELSALFDSDLINSDLKSNPDIEPVESAKTAG
jgi:glutathione-regulated potassium-efflux system protein KefB